MSGKTQIFQVKIVITVLQKIKNNQTQRNQFQSSTQTYEQGWFQ